MYFTNSENRQSFEHHGRLARFNSDKHTKSKTRQKAGWKKQMWLNQILSVSAGLMSWGMALICVYLSLVCFLPVMHCPALLEEHRRQAERVTCYIGHGSQTHWCVKITAPLTQLGQLHTSVSTATHTPSDLKHTHAHIHILIISQTYVWMCCCSRLQARLTILFRSEFRKPILLWCLDNASIIKKYV